MRITQGDHAPVVILGAGPAGLAAAWECQLAGRPVVLVEKAAEAGGLCATVERDGFRFDLGGHRIISQHRDLVERISALLGPDLLVRSRRSVICLGGRRYAYPLEARDLVGTLPPGVALRALVDYAVAAARRTLAPREAVTFEDWVTDRFGRTLYDLFFGPYTHKLWGRDPALLSADWAAQRISLLNLADVGLRLVGLRRGGARTYARRYHYPRLGIGMLFDRLLEHLLARGVRFVGGADVIALERGERHVSAVVVRTGRAAERIPCASVISTVPLPALARLCEVPDTAKEAASRLGWRGMRFLNFMLRGAPLSDATWTYVGDADLVMTRIQEPIQRSPEMAPPGCTSAMLEIPADPGEAAWEDSDATLAERALADLARVGFDVRGRVLGCFSTRTRDAYPVYHLGYRADRERVLDAIGRLENVHPCGRQGLFRYVFMDTAMEMGSACARAAMSGTQARWRAVMELDAHPQLQETRAVTA